MKRFFEHLFGSQGNEARPSRQLRRRNTIQTRIETLEERKLCAADCTITFDSAEGVVKMNGSELRDSATVDYVFTSAGTFVKFNLLCNYNTPSEQQKTLLLNATQVKVIAFYGFGGDDQFNNQTAISSFADGGAGADTLLGGSAKDLFYGGLGSDYLRGMGGDDELVGFDFERTDDARDIIYGGPGLDQILGGMGDDWLYGEGDADDLHGDQGNDVLYGGGGTDTLNGQSGNDLLYGGTEDDDLIGGVGADQLYGEAGNDKLDGNDRTAGIYQDRQVDKLVGGSGIDTFLLAYWWEVDRSGTRRKVYEERPADKAFYEISRDVEVQAPRPYHHY